MAVPCGLRAIRADFAHYCELHAARSLVDKLLLPLRAPSFLALAVYRYGRWVRECALPGPLKLPLRALHVAAFEAVRHLTGVLLQTWTEVEERVWFGSFGPIIASAERISSGSRIHAGATLGSNLSQTRSGAPFLERDVVVGPGAIVAGPVRVAAGAVIGPNTFVSKSIAAGVFIGTPCHRTARAAALVLPKGAHA